MSDIGKKMLDQRKMLGLTLEEVGDAVGVGKSTVRKWENGIIKNMRRDKIAALANVLQMNPLDLVPDDPITDGMLPEKVEVKIRKPRKKTVASVVYDFNEKEEVKPVIVTKKRSCTQIMKTLPVGSKHTKDDDELLRLWGIASSKQKKDALSMLKTIIEGVEYK